MAGELDEIESITLRDISGTFPCEETNIVCEEPPQFKEGFRLKTKQNSPAGEDQFNF